MPVSISKLPEVTNVKDNSFMLITQDGTTKRTMCDQFVTEEEARLDEFSPTVITSKSMSKTGEGDNVDYSSSVYDAPMKDVILKGKTMVNCIQEPSSQDVVLPYEFEEGQYVTINDTKESGALGVELKGQTLVNLHATTHTPSLASAEQGWYENYTRVNGSISFDVTSLPTRWRYIDGGNISVTRLKPNTKYFVKFDSVTNITSLNFMRGDGTSIISTTGTVINNYAIVTTKSAIVENNQILYIMFEPKIGQQVGYTNPRIFEYQEGMENWDIPYFEGMTSCKMPILCTVGKNLFDLTNAPNGYLTADNPYTLASSDHNNKTSAYIKVKPNTKYTYSFDGFTPSQVGNTYWTGFYYYKRIGEVSTVHPSRITFSSSSEEHKQITFTTPSDCNYIRIGSRGLMLNGATAQLEEATSATSYEPYKTSILSLPEEVVLRKIRNVYETIEDTLSCSTGIMKSYVNELTLNGSEDWNLYRDRESNTIAFMFHAPHGRMRQIGVMSCDKVPVYTQNEALKLEDKEWCFYNDHGSPIVFINVLRSKLTSPDVAGFKTWLRENNVKIQYPSETPIVTKINLPSTLKSWNTTTHIYSEIPENSLYPILSHSNPTYPVILKPSTKYSIVANSYSNNHTNSAINFNLGGTTASTTVGNRVTTITTPSTLSNELLTMSGRGNKLNNVMVIEGDVAGDEPYFEGICDCKTPILLNTGKNLFNIHDYSPYEFTFSGGYPRELNSVYGDRLQIVDDEIHYKTMGSNHHLNQGVGYYIPLKPNTKYTFKASRKFGDRLWALKLFLIHQDERLEGMKSPIQEPTRFGYNNENNSNPVEATFNSSKYNCLMVYIGGGWEDGVKGQRSYIFNDISLVEEGQEIEPYKSNTTTFEQKDDKTIVLRSLPNGVCDTLNIETGEYVQRIGEYRVTGGEEETYGTDGEAQYIYIGNASALMGMKNTSVLICDKFPYHENYSMYDYPIVSSTWVLIFVLPTSATGLSTKAEREAYIKNLAKTEGITVQYELETPIVSTIDVQGFPYAYANGHVQLSSGSIEQSLTPKIEYNIATNRGGQITQNTKSLIRQGKLLNDIESKINQIIEATVNDGVMLMKLRNK